MKQRIILAAMTAMAMTSASQAVTLAVSIDDLGGNSYKFTVVNNGTTFDVSDGNDVFDISNGATDPVFNFGGTTAADPAWRINNAASTTHNISFQADGPGLTPFTNGSSLVFTVETGSPATSFDWVFQLENDPDGEFAYSGTANVGGTFLVTPPMVPEPSSAALLGLGAIGVILRRRR